MKVTDKITLNCATCCLPFTREYRRIQPYREKYDGKDYCSRCLILATAERKKAKEPVCRKCDIPLIENQNWHGSNVANRNLICKACYNTRFRGNKEYRDKWRDYETTRRNANRESVKAYARQWHKKDRKENPEKYREARQKWLQSPRGKADNRARASRRKADLKSRTPQWANASLIKEVYLAAQLLSEQTGIPHEVDHLVPLSGKTVYGLHVEYNLRVIPKSENAKKSNKFSNDLLETWLSEPDLDR